MKDTIRFVITLVIVTLLSSFILSLLYTKVRAKIELQQKAVQNDAVNFVLDNPHKLEEVQSADHKYWKGLDSEGNLKGYVVLCEGKGFSSTIKIIAGVNVNGKINKIRVIAQQETPGLGAAMNAVKSNKYIWDLITGKKREKVDPNPYFQKQFFGTNYNKLEIVKRNPEKKGEIEALTGATISSKAVVKAIKDGITGVMAAEEGGEK